MDPRDRLDKEIQAIEDDWFLTPQERVEAIRELEREYGEDMRAAAREASEREPDRW